MVTDRDDSSHVWRVSTVLVSRRVAGFKKEVYTCVACLFLVVEVLSGFICHHLRIGSS